MTIEKINTPYEILYRLNEDGSVRGCHRRELQTIKDTDTSEVYSVKEVGPFPIEGADMEAVLGEINAALSLGVSQRDETISDIKGRLRQAIDGNEVLAQENSDLKNSLRQAIDGNTALRNTIAELQAQLESIKATPSSPEE